MRFLNLFLIFIISLSLLTGCSAYESQGRYQFEKDFENGLLIKKNSMYFCGSMGVQDLSNEPNEDFFCFYPQQDIE